MKTLSAIAVITAAAISLSACTLFQGPVLTPADLDGQVTTEQRDHEDFTAVALAGFGNLTVRQGAAFGMEVTTDSALHEHITTSVVDGTLRIGQEFTFIGSVPPLEYVVTLPDLTGLTLSGAGAITATGIDAHSLGIEVNGVGNVLVVGRARHASLTISGTGNADLSQLRTGELSVEVRGVGDAQVTATRLLNAHIAGAGSIVATGTASEARVRVSGTGDFQGAGFEAREATVEIAGMGNIHIGVTDHLDASVSGLGDVVYYGDPQVTRSVSGLGNVRQGG